MFYLVSLLQQMITNTSTEVTINYHRELPRTLRLQEWAVIFGFRYLQVVLYLLGLMGTVVWWQTMLSLVLWLLLAGSTVDASLVTKIVISDEFAFSWVPAEFTWQITIKTKIIRFRLGRWGSDIIVNFRSNYELPRYSAGLLYYPASLQYPALRATTLLLGDVDFLNISNAQCVGKQISLLLSFMSIPSRLMD